MRRSDAEPEFEDSHTGSAGRISDKCAVLEWSCREDFGIHIKKNLEFLTNPRFSKAAVHNDALT